MFDIFHFFSGGWVLKDRFGGLKCRFEGLKCLFCREKKRRKQRVLFPVSRTSTWINFGFDKAKLESNANKFGRKCFFGGGPETLEKQGQKIRYLNSLSKFAENFAGNSSKIRRTKIKNSPQIRSAEPRHQQREETKIKIPRKGSQSCALENATKTMLIYCSCADAARSYSRSSRTLLFWVPSG